MQSLGQPETTTRPSTSEFTDHERDSTAYFFLRLQNLYGSRYTAQFPEQEDIRLAKREWARQIGRYTRDQIHQMFEDVKRIQAAGDRKLAERFDWPNVGAILALHAQGWEHRVHTARAAETDRMLADNRLRLTDQGKQDRARKAGAAALDQLRGMFRGTAAGMTDGNP